MYREYRSKSNQEIKAELNRYNKNIQALIKEFRQHQWVTTCEEINQKKGKSYWHDIKKLSKYNNKITTINSLKKDGQEYKTNEEKAGLFANHFKEVYKQTQD